MSFNNKKIEKLVGIASLVAILIFCITKLFSCSVSFHGDACYQCIISDYWNMTKSIANGSRLYVDVIDHKGLYLYLLYLPFVLLGKNSMWPVVLAEFLIFTGTVAAFYYMVAGFVKEKSHRVVLTALFSASYLILSKNAALFNTDTLLVPFYFVLFRYVTNPKIYKPRDFFLIGLVIGFFVNIKYASILYFIGLFVFASFAYLYQKNRFAKYLKLVASGVLGAFVVNLPFLFYLLKTKTLRLFFYYMKLSSGASMKRCVILFTLFAVCIALTCFLYAKRRKYLWGLAVSSLLVSYIGMFFNPNYIAVAVLLLAPACLSCKKMVFYTIFSFLFIVATMEDASHYSTKQVADSYGISNSNIVYLTEDVGFGSYKPDGFKEPYQWIPARFLKNDAFYQEILELNRERILEKRFRFFILADYSKVEEIDENDRYYKICEELRPVLEKTYHPIEISISKETALILWELNEGH